MTLIRERLMYVTLWPVFIVGIAFENQRLDRLQREAIRDQSPKLALLYVNDQYDFSRKVIPMILGMSVYAISLIVFITVF